MSEYRMADKRNILPLLLILLFLGCTGKDIPGNEMAYFEGGAIWVGSEEGEINEYPVQQVSVDPFYISKN